MKTTYFSAVLLLCAAALFSSCSKDENEVIDPDSSDSNGSMTNPTITDVTYPTFETAIKEYSGETATDASSDAVGTDEDFYWEANSFKETVTVAYDGSTATVTTTNSSILYDVQGAYVTIDMLTNSVKNVEVIVKGSSSDGQLKIYGEKKFKLTLSGVELTSKRGPAINDQCKKRAFVHLTDGTVNKLTDASSYSDDTYYLNGATADDEDRKGCFFSEGNLIFSGTGSLVINGNYKHGLVTDGYLYVRPGVTIAVENAAKNAIHVKGDSDELIGVVIKGGLIYANTSATAGKCIKSDENIEISGGVLELNTSGGSEYDSDDQDTSSPSCIKSDKNVLISAGTITLKSTGMGGKGISADEDIQIDGGDVTVTTTGGKYYYTNNLTSSPKGIKADGNITINNGKVYVSVTGVSDGSEGIESKAALVINDGEVYVYAYDDAMNAAEEITINGGKVYCYAVNNDGIDSNGTLNLNGGLVISSGTNAPEEGFDCDASDKFKVTGGILIGTGGSAVSPSTSSSQNILIYNGISAVKGGMINIVNSSNESVLSYVLPRQMNGMSLFFSSPALTKGTYTLCGGGALSGASYSWYEWYSGGTWSNGESLGSFTVNSVVTTVGNSQGGGNNPGGNNPGGPGRP